MANKLSNEAAKRLDENHYLGSRGARARLVYEDEHGLIAFSSPTSRRLPQDWLELSRWCIRAGGIGSRQFRECLDWLDQKTGASTIVSYSDPSVGHGGALYRASGWVWAPTWHVLRPPPTGGGLRGGKVNPAKHRWVFLRSRDERREQILMLRDDALRKRYPFAEYKEPKWKRGIPQISEMASNYKKWVESWKK